MRSKESTEKWQSCLLSRVCCCHYEALPDLNTDSYPFIFHLHIHIQMDSLNPQHLILTYFCYYALNKSQTRLRIFAPFFFKFTGEFTQVKADAKLLFTPKSEERQRLFPIKQFMKENLINAMLSGVHSMWSLILTVGQI